MTQASLSPDLHGALGAETSARSGGRSATPSAAAFWMVAITSMALVVTSVLILLLISRNVITDASLGGFVSGIGMVVAFIGVGGVSYALVSARRAGYLDLTLPPPSAPTIIPAGMHVVPAVPADLGRRKRLQLEAERAARSRQAKAIATAAATRAAIAAVSAPPARSPRVVTPPVMTPRPPRAVVAHTAAARGARPGAAHQAPVPAPVSARPASVPRPAITMPRPMMRQPRPAAWPSRAPVMRMAPPPMRPRTQVATFQVNAANVRAASPVRPR